MRNLIIILAFTVVFAAGAVFSDLYINTLTDEMLAQLEACETQQDIEELTEAWSKRSSIAELVIDHGEIDLLNQYLWAMQVEIVYDYDEFMESKKLAMEMFKHIAERNTFSLYNIL